MALQNIIFDLGGVLLDIDHQKTIDAFAQLGLENAEEAFSKEVQSDLFQDFERGRISSTDFIAALKHYMPQAEEGEIIKSWNALLGQFPIERFELLAALADRFRLFLLSNTNSVHEAAFHIIIENALGWKNFENLFEGVGYSHELKERKPERVIFEKMLELHHLNPAETGFIDDTLVHVLAARQVGIRAIHLDESMSLSEAVEKLLCSYGL